VGLLLDLLEDPLVLLVRAEQDRVTQVEKTARAKKLQELGRKLRRMALLPSWSLQVL